MPAPPEEFFTLAEEIGVAFDPGDIERFSDYLDRLLDVNTHFNLTAIRDPDQAWTRHILDSLTLMPMLAALDASEPIADVGSGGGAPGLVLAIALPELRFNLIESTGKKARFLEETADALALPNVTIHSTRAEDAGRDAALRDCHAAATARALGPLRVALELVMPLVRPGGFGLFIKGEKAQAEIRDANSALDRLRCSVADLVATPTGTIVVIEKEAPTPRDFPRRPGEPKRDPL